ncbi:FAD binding domain protein [Sinomonas atrocyanea]|uniref:FAD binding domain protein n=1 Tax=Sinomonas atrocyanea TaxID=37927 RepID=A0A127A5R0_9MICC|nr:NAD(P)/FAD-dependent oxidoreductase [Sinomonas atrocyanea]AMM34251.1 FAD binding domain protein [Sinomonas atrocyanea]GEB64720.1 oxidoreductase [Sinomonas atrocyanea]
MGARHDIAVVGAGPVGLCFAVLLADLGLDVAVLEARPQRSRHTRAIGIHPPGLRVLARAGVAETVAAAGVPLREGAARTRDSGATRTVARIAFRPPVLAVPQWATEQALEDRLAVLAPAALRRGVRAVRAEQQEGGAVVRCEDGESVAARWVIAADGARSPLRAGLGIPVRTRALPDAYLMGDFADATGDGERAVLHLEAAGIVESFPLPGGVRRWVAHVPEPALDPSARDLARIVGERTGVRPDPSTCTMLSAFTVTERLAARLRSGRVLLAGDAAHEVSPIGGQGMNLGWLDAEAFVPLIAADVRARRDAPGPAWDELWAATEAERLRAAWSAARQARVNMALGRALPPGAMAARNTAFRALYRVPWLAERTAARFTMQG